jgi:hypothetical protein
LQSAQWTEGTKYCSQASHLVKPLQGFCLQQMAHKTEEIGKKEKKSTNKSVKTQKLNQGKEKGN